MITNRSLGAIIYFLCKGCFLGIGFYTLFEFSKNNSYLSVILGFILGLIPLIATIYIYNKCDTNVIEYIDKKFGKIGKIINLCVSIFFIFVSIILIYNLCMFVKLEYMQETDLGYILILLIVGISFLLKYDIDVISRVSVILIAISIIMFLVTILGLFSNVEITNFMPLNISDSFLGGIYYSIYASLPMFLILTIDKTKVKGRIGKTMFLMYTFSNLTLLVFILLIIGVLGYPLMSIYKYPEYISLKKVTLFNFIEKVENIVAIQFFFDSIMLIIMCNYYSIKAFSKKINKNIVRYILIALMFISIYIFKNTNEFTKFIEGYFPVIVGIILSALYILVVIRIFIDNIYKNKKVKLNSK